VSRNIVLLILDTVRKDYFDEYALRLQSMSDVSFTQCHAASSCSVPSHSSIFTGKLPHQHGLHSTRVDYSEISRSETFLRSLPAHSKLGVSANTFAGSAFGFDTYFDSFVDVSWTRRFPEGMDIREYQNDVEDTGLEFYLGFLRECLRHDNPVKSLANGAFAQLDLLSAKSPLPKVFDDGGSAAIKQARNLVRSESEPFFLFMNLMDVHSPHHHIRSYDRSLHDVPSSWTTVDDIDLWEINLDPGSRNEENVRNFRELYASAIDYLDRKVTSFVSDLLETTDRETTVVVTSDHGENLGFDADDRLMGHSYGLSEGLLHVPLEIINPPEGYDTRETEYFSHLQLGELITGMSEGETPDVFTDTPVAERITMSGVPDAADDPAFWKRTIRCVYEGNEKSVWDSEGRSVTYDLDESKPCWQRQRDETSVIPEYDSTHFDIDIRTTHDRMAEGTSLSDDVDEATKDRLEELGYL